MCKFFVKNIYVFDKMLSLDESLKLCKKLMEKILVKLIEMKMDIRILYLFVVLKFLCKIVLWFEL